MRLVAFLLAIPLAGQDFYRALNDGRHAHLALGAYLKQKANEALEAREKRLGTITDWEAYRKKFREDVLRSIGGLPPKTPLNARVVGAVEAKGYRIEKVIFESQPKFYVTANLYLPSSGKGPHPAILFPLGHEAGAKAHSAWQIVLANLARRGFVLLAWDPVGQGERIQLWDDDLRGSKVVQSTTEHTLVGTQSLLLGDAMARFTIHDGIRALDYLLSRPEVDPKRVGLTGNSGGGTHTSYIAALEDRIQVAAPSCYLTNWRKLLDTIGPQDAEQCFPGFLADGHDHPDFVLSFAPKPFLILSAIRDFFPIGGARSTYAESRRIYDSLGKAGNIAMVEADDGHGYTQPRREAAYRWFTRWLKGTEDTTPESDVELFTEKQLNCTTTGQVLTSLGGESVYTLNRKRMAEIRKTGTAEDVRRVARYVHREAPVKVHPYGGSGTVERLVYETEPGIPVPAVLYKPAGAGRHPGRLIVHGRGKAAAADLAKEVAASGQVVLAIDARGLGETGPGDSARSGSWTAFLGDYEHAMTGMLLNRPLPTMRAEDVAAGIGFLAARSDVDGSQLSVVGIGHGAIPALLAAALDKRIKAVHLDGMLTSYEDVLQYRIHRRIFDQVIPGALRAFDLGDLKRLASNVTETNAVDPLGLPAN